MCGHIIILYDVMQRLMEKILSFSSMTVQLTAVPCEARSWLLLQCLTVAP